MRKCEIHVINDNTSDFHHRVIKIMEAKLNHHKMLARYTKQTVKLKQHLLNIKIYEELIQEAKEEYGRCE